MSRFNTAPAPKKAFSDTVADTPVSVEVLLDILRRPRFADTPGERYVIDTYLRPLPGASVDGGGNIWVTIGTNPTTMFSSHTDTVHKAKDERRSYPLTIKDNIVTATGGGVLGADCGTGIWLMLNLIKAGIPGLYVFHRGEEIGGVGSTYIAECTPDRLAGINHCIAFDRKGTDSVITEQGCGVCTSMEFAIAFCGALNATPGFKFVPDDSGTFTDSANYVHLIPECTNLSVGYYNQHTLHESQDVSFAAALANALIGIDFAALPASRDPEAEHDDHFLISAIEQHPDIAAALLTRCGYDLETFYQAIDEAYSAEVDGYYATYQ